MGPSLPDGNIFPHGCTKDSLHSSASILTFFTFEARSFRVQIKAHSLDLHASTNFASVTAPYSLHIDRVTTALVNCLPSYPASDVCHCHSPSHSIHLCTKAYLDSYSNVNNQHEISLFTIQLQEIMFYSCAVLLRAGTFAHSRKHPPGIRSIPSTKSLQSQERYTEGSHFMLCICCTRMKSAIATPVEAAAAARAAA